MKKNYNYLRKTLILPEYGRHIHEMVDYLMTIDNSKERNRQTRAVIAVMGNLYPALRDTPDFTHKLWDHMFLMSGFRLEVDSPYPIPTAASLAPIPARLAYPRKNIRFKHYGRNVESMIRALEHVRNRDAVEEAIGNIAKYMRSKSYEYNQEHPDNAVIIKDIKTMSGNDIEVDEIAIGNIRSDYKQHLQAYSKRGPHQGRNGKNTKGQQKQQLLRKPKRK